MILAIYTRLSREDDKSTSIDNQIREGKAFAKKQNYQFTIYNEGEGVSGTLELSDRPELLNLINDIKNEKISNVWMRNQNRLDRNTGTFYLFVSAVKKADVNVYFGDGDALDFNDPTTLLQTSIISSLNQYQAQLQSVQTKKALRDNVNEGKAWGVLPYGYTTNTNKHITINDVEAQTVKEIFDLSLEGWGVKRISTHLTEKGIPTRYNGYEGEMKNVNKYDKSVKKKNYNNIVWSAKTVLDILKNKWYIGTRTYSGVEYPTPTIIDKLLFSRVGKNLVKNRKNSGKKVEYRYLLKGLLRCGKCDRNYYGRTRASKNDNFYMCSSKRYPALNCGNKSISIPFLETFIIKHLFQSKDLLKRLQSLEKNDNSLNVLSKELDQVKTNLENEVKTADRIAKRLLNEELSNDQLFINKYSQSKTQIKSYKERIEAIEQRIKERTNNDRIKAYKDEVETVDLTNFTQLKKAINNIIEIIELSSFKTMYNSDYYQIEIKYRGFNEISIFTTEQPYELWYYEGGILIKPDEENKEYPVEDRDNYDSDGDYNPLEITKSELIHFN
jgi:site-specific DNA recombinase